MPHPVFFVSILLLALSPSAIANDSPPPQQAEAAQQTCWEPAPANSVLVNEGLTRRHYLQPKRDVNGNQIVLVRRKITCSPSKKKQ